MQDQLGGNRIKANQGRVLAEGNGACNDVIALRDIDDVILFYRLAEDLGIVGCIIADRAEGGDVHPAVHRRDGRDIVLGKGRKAVERGHVAYSAELRLGSHVVLMQAESEGIDAVDLGRSLDGGAAVTVAYGYGHLAAGGVEDTDLIRAEVGFAYHDGGIGDVLEYAVLHEELVVPGRVDLESDGGVLHPHPLYYPSSLLAADSGLALAFELGVEHGELPAGRSLGSVDAVISSEEAYMVHLIPNVEEAGFAASDVDVAEGDEAVLGIMGTQCYRAGISLADAEIDVGECTVESAGARISHILLVPHNAAGEPEHILRFSFIGGVGGLEAGRIVSQDEFGTALAVTDKPDGVGDVDGIGNNVLSFGNEDDSEVLFLL